MASQERDAAGLALREMVETVARGHEAALVLLVGEYGMGKSRLLTAALQPPLGNLRVLRTAVDPSGGAGSLFSQLVRGLAGLEEAAPTDDEPVSRRLSAERAKLMEGLGITHEEVTLLDQLGLGVGTGDVPQELDDPEQMDARRRALVRGLLESQSVVQPLCWIIDDLDQADEGSQRMLRAILKTHRGALCVVATLQPDVFGPIDWTNIGQCIELAPLSDADAAEFLGRELGREVSSETDWVKALIDASERSPRSLMRNLRLLRDSGWLKGWGEALRVDAARATALKYPREDDPEDVFASLRAGEKSILAMAATVGVRFAVGDLLLLTRTQASGAADWRGQTHDVSALVLVLEGLVERRILRRLGPQVFAFRDARLSRALRASLADGLRRKYDALLAGALGHRLESNPSDVLAERVAKHRQRSGDPIGAALAFIRAGDCSRRASIHGQAVEHYERALGMLGELEPMRRFHALHNYGDSLRTLGRIDDAVETYREMLALGFELNLPSKAGVAQSKLGRLDRDTGMLDEAEEHLRCAQALFESAADERGVAATMDDLGQLAHLRGDSDGALALLREGLMRRRRLSDRKSIALSLHNLALVLMDGGERGQAREAMEQALSIRRAIQDSSGTVATLCRLGQLEEEEGRFERAEDLLAEAARISADLGDLNQSAVVLIRQGALAHRRGQVERAIATLERAESMCDELGDRLGLAEALRALGELHLLCGDLPRAKDAIGLAVEHFAAARCRVHLATALRVLGNITAAGGWGASQTKSAREYYDRSLRILEECHNEPELTKTLEAYANFLTSEPSFAEEAAMQALARELRHRIEGRMQAAVTGAYRARPAPAT